MKKGGDQAADHDARVVICPKCSNRLIEPTHVPLYICGGCETILQAKYYNNRNKKEEEDDDEDKPKLISKDDNVLQQNHHHQQGGETTFFSAEHSPVLDIIETPAQNDNNQPGVDLTTSTMEKPTNDTADMKVHQLADGEAAGHKKQGVQRCEEGITAISLDQRRREESSEKSAEEYEIHPVPVMEEDAAHLDELSSDEKANEQKKREFISNLEQGTEVREMNKLLLEADQNVHAQKTEKDQTTTIITNQKQQPESVDVKIPDEDVEEPAAAAANVRSASANLLIPNKKKKKKKPVLSNSKSSTRNDDRCNTTTTDTTIDEIKGKRHDRDSSTKVPPPTDYYHNRILGRNSEGGLWPPVRRPPQTEEETRGRRPSSRHSCEPSTSSNLIHNEFTNHHRNSSHHVRVRRRNPNHNCQSDTEQRRREYYNSGCLVPQQNVPLPHHHHRHYRPSSSSELLYRNPMYQTRHQYPTWASNTTKHPSSSSSYNRIQYSREAHMRWSSDMRWSYEFSPHNNLRQGHNSRLKAFEFHPVSRSPYPNMEDDNSRVFPNYRRQGINQMAGMNRRQQNSGERHVRPVASGAPFITCDHCSTVLMLPSDFLLFKSGGSRRVHRLKCDVCSSTLEFHLQNEKHLLPCCTCTPERVTSAGEDVEDMGTMRAGSASLQHSAYREVLPQRSSTFPSHQSQVRRDEVEEPMSRERQQQSILIQKHTRNKGKAVMMD